MRRQLTVAIWSSIVLISFMAGCRKISNQVEDYQMQEVFMDTTELTDEEVQLLCQAFIDSDRIQRGEILSYEKALLQQFHFGKEYLAQKYPDKQFKFGNCIPQNNINPYTSLSIWTEEDSKKRYDFRIETLADGSFIASDNFYGSLIHDEYALRLEQMATGCLGVWVNIPYLYGEEYDAELSLDILLKKGFSLYADGAIYFDASLVEQSGEICESIRKELTNSGFKGDFWIYFLEGQPDGWLDIEELRSFVNRERDEVVQSRERIIIS